MEPSSVEKEKVGEEEEWEYYEEEEEEYEPDEFDLLEPIEMLDYQEQVICEEQNECGAAHLIEHLALEGYGYSNSDALEYLQALKDQCGAHQNAITSRDHTFYDFSVNSLVDLKKALGLIAAISLELRFSSDELQKEKCVVSDKLWHDSQNVEKQLYNTRIAHVFQGTKYAEPVGGTIQTVKDLSVDIVKGFYMKWYVPNNMAIIVVGDVTETQSIIGLIKTYFERKPRGKTQYLEFPLPKHRKTRLTTHVNSAIVKRGMSVIYAGFMYEKKGCKCVNDLSIYIQENLLQRVILRG
ncbi:hypothetical protein P3S67_024675 [Capsicum chacoense]